MLFIIKISRVLSHELSPHGLPLTFDPTFSKHELLFVLIIIIIQNTATLRLQVQLIIAKDHLY